MCMWYVGVWRGGGKRGESEGGGRGGAPCDHRRYPQKQVVQAADWKFENKDLNNNGLDAREPPEKDQHTENDPGNPSLSNFARAMTVLAARAAVRFVSFESPNFLGMPEQEQDDHGRHGPD